MLPIALTASLVLSVTRINVRRLMMQEGVMFRLKVGAEIDVSRQFYLIFLCEEGGTTNACDICVV